VPSLIEEHLAISHIKDIVVWTLIENEKAIKFYQSLGFKQTTWKKQTNIDNKYYDEIALIKIYND
jgi:RimJ/RimL family protein N-acetyltransferase